MGVSICDQVKTTYTLHKQEHMQNEYLANRLIHVYLKDHR